MFALFEIMCPSNKCPPQGSLGGGGGGGVECSKDTTYAFVDVYYL